VARYRTEFIDVIAAHFKNYPELPIVVILEPDSLGNLVTNMNIPNCVAARDAYVNSTAYAIQKLALPNVSIYLDAAHAGWLGWDHHREALIKVYKKVLKAAGGVDMIRGFATNVSNYTHLTNRDGMAMESSDPCYNEMVYVKKLAVGLADHGVRNKGFIIDTSRNGKGGIRKVWVTGATSRAPVLASGPGQRQSPSLMPFSGSSRRENRMACPTRPSPVSMRNVRPVTALPTRHKRACGSSRTSTTWSGTPPRRSSPIGKARPFCARKASSFDVARPRRSPCSAPGARVENIGRSHARIA